MCRSEIQEGKIVGEYQLLCANCNWIKRHTNDEVPKVSHMREAKLARYYKDEELCVKG